MVLWGLKYIKPYKNFRKKYIPNKKNTKTNNLTYKKKKITQKQQHTITRNNKRQNSKSITTALVQYVTRC